MKYLVILATLLSATTANAAVYGELTAAPKSVKMSATLTAQSELILKVVVNEKVEQCKVSLISQNMGGAVPTNFSGADIANTQFFALWLGRECVEISARAAAYAKKRAFEIGFFEQTNTPPKQGLDMLTTSDVKLSFCFQPGDGQACSKPLSRWDLNTGDEIQIFPFQSR